MFAQQNAGDFTIENYIQKAIRHCCPIDNQSADIQFCQREIKYQVQELFYALYEKQAIQEILRDNKNVLNTYEEMAAFAMSNNLVSLGDVLDIGIQRNELHSKSFRVYNEIEAYKKNLNRLLGQEIDATLIIETKLSVLDILMGTPQIDTLLLNKANYFTTLFDNPFIFVNSLKTNPTFDKKNQLIQLESILEKELLSYNNAMVEVFSAQKNGNEIKRVIDLILQSYQTDPLKYKSLLKLQMKQIKYQIMEIEATKKAFMAKAKIDFLSQP